MRQINYIIIHCSATKAGSDFHAKDIDKWHRERGWDGIGYHKVVTKDSVIHQLLDISKVSNGVYGYNSPSTNIAYVGSIDSKGKPVDNRTKAQKVSLRHK